MRKLHTESKYFFIIVLTVLLALMSVLGVVAQGTRSIVSPVANTHTYEFYDGATLVRTQILQNGQTLVEPPTPAKIPGKIFTGWKIAGTPVTFGPVTVTSTEMYRVDATYQDGYYVYFVFDGQVIATKIVTPGATTDDSGVNYVIQETNKIFSHWSETLNGPTPFSFSTAIQKDTTLYLVKKDAATVKFNSHGGSYVPTAYVNLNSPVPQPADPSYQGYTFSHWSKTENGPAYNFSTPVNNSMTLHAVWNPSTATYKVAYFTENAEDDLYSFATSRSRTGTTGQPATYDPLGWTGYTFDHIDPVTIAGDGSTILKVYYRRNVHTFTIEYRNRYSPYDWIIFNTTSYKYGQSTAPAYNAAVAAYPTYQWYITRTSNTAYSEAPAMPNGNLTVYGRHSGSVPNIIRYQEKGTFKTIHADYVFYGSGTYYSFTIEDGIDILGFTVTPIGEWKPLYGGDGTIYYTRNNYKMQFHKNNGSNMFEVANIPYEKELSFIKTDYAAEVELHEKTENGITYQFDGWYDNEFFFGNPYSFVGQSMPPRDLVMYAKWVPKPIELTYCRTVDAVNCAVTTVDYNATLLPSQISTIEAFKTVPTGMTASNFVGWYQRGPLGNLIPFDLQHDKVPNPITIVPVYKGTGFNVTYLAGAGSGTVTDPTLYAYGSDATLLEGTALTPPATKKFCGWKLTGDASGRIYYPNESIHIDDNKQFTAQYCPDIPKTQVTYRAGLGTGADVVVPDLEVNTMHTVYGVGTGANQANFTRTGWVFDKWKAANGNFYQPGNQVTVTAEGTAPNTKNVFTAEWKRAVTNVTATKTWDGGPASAHVSVKLRLIRRVNGAMDTTFSEPTPTISPDPTTTPTSDTFTYIWANVETHTKEGVEYQYQVMEQLTPDQQVYCEPTITQGATPYQFNVTNRYKSPLINVPVQKVWKGGYFLPKPEITLSIIGTCTRPGGAACEQILRTATINDGNATVTQDAGTWTVTWDYLWKDLPERDRESGTLYTYYVQEDANPGTNWVSDCLPSQSAHLKDTTCINTYKPPLIPNPNEGDGKVTGTKIWQGGKATGYANMTMTLMRRWKSAPNADCTLPDACGAEEAVTKDRDGVTIAATVDLLKANATTHNWKNTWTNLPETDAYTGYPYTYWIVEPNDPGAVDLPFTGKFVQVDDSDLLTVTNKYIPPLVNEDDGDPNTVDGEVIGKKLWSGGSANERVDIAIVLKRQWKKAPNANCSQADQCGPLEEVTVNRDGGVVNPNVTLAKANAANHNWQYTWTNLAWRDFDWGYLYYYEIEETNSASLGGNYSEITDADPLTVTNQYQSPKITITATKNWIGGEKLDRPAVTLTLCRTSSLSPNFAVCGGSIPQQQIQAAAVDPVSGVSPASATVTWTGMDQKDPSGIMYLYWVTEGPVTNYDEVPRNLPSSTAAELLTVTNRFKSPTSSINAEIVWHGGQDARPAVIAQLYRYTTVDANGVPTDSAPVTRVDPGTATTGGTMNFSFGNQDQYDPHGIAYVYYMDIIPATAGLGAGDPDPLEVVGDPSDEHYLKIEEPQGGTGDTPQSHNYDLRVDLRYRSAKTNFSVDKQWVGGGAAGPRPTVWFKLQRNGIDMPVAEAPYQELVDPATRVTWTDLDKNDAGGTAYTYSAVEIKQDGTPWSHPNYTVTANAAGNLFTNTYGSAQSPVTGTIEWQGGKGPRPDVNVRLCRESVIVAKTCTAADIISDPDLSHTWTLDVPVTDADGNPFTYTMENVNPVPTNYVVHSQVGLHIIYRYVPTTIPIQTTKEWFEGQLQRKAIRMTLMRKLAGSADTPVKVPTADLLSLTGTTCETVNPVTLTPDAALTSPDTVSDSKTWCVVDADFNGNSYEYSVVESLLDDRLWDSTHDPANPYLVKNTFKPPYVNWDDNDPTNDGKLVLTKKWINGRQQRPASITFNLMQAIENDPNPATLERSVTLTPANAVSGDPDTWQITVMNVYDMNRKGQKYIYTVTEDPITKFDLVSINNPTLTITNKFKVPTATVNIGLIWVDGPATKPPTKIVLNCVAPGQTVPVYTSTYDMPNGTTTVNGVNVPMTDTEGNPLTCSIHQPGGAPSPYEETINQPGGVPITGAGPFDLTITNTYHSLPRTVTATKTWINGDKANGGVLPTVWFKLYRKTTGGTEEAVPNAAVLALTNGTTSVRWENIDETDHNGNVYTFFVRETDVNGNDWTPANYTKDENDTVVINTYVPPTGDVIGRKQWGRGSSPRPIVWLQLFRQIKNGQVEPVPLNQAPLKELANGVTEAKWVDVELTTIDGEDYTFTVREVDANGVDWVAPGYEKIENGLTVRNLKQSRLHVGVTMTPYSTDTFSLIAAGADGMVAQQTVDIVETDATYPAFLVRDNLRPVLHTVLIDRLNLEDWSVEGISCVMRPYGSTDPAEDQPLAITPKRNLFGKLVGEFTIAEMPLEKDVICMIQLQNLRASQIVVKNVTYPHPDITGFPDYHYDTEGLAYNPFVLSGTSEPNVQEVVPGKFAVTQQDVSGWTTLDVIVESSINGRRPMKTLDQTGGVSRVDFDVIPNETVTVTFVNVPPNTIMLKKLTIPAKVNDKFKFTGIFDVEIGDSEYVVRTFKNSELDGKQWQVQEHLHEGWTKHSVRCVEKGKIGPTETRADFYTMSAYYGLDEGEMILCTFVNRAWGVDEFPDIFDPDIPESYPGMPRTGFAPGVVTQLPEQPAAKLYSPSKMTLDIPQLNQSLEIVGIPVVDGEWDVTWLKEQAGYLEGSAYPTHNGNSVITAHVWDAYNNPGPFAGLKELRYGDTFTITAYGKTYTYEVRESERIPEANVDELLVQKNGSWVTLMTCEGYNEGADQYAYRRFVRAVLIDTK